jgi:uncharacterized membrane protein YhaH (DUF805 family)
MDFKQLFLSANGRIGRQTFWIAIAIFIAIYLVLYSVLGLESSLFNIIGLVMLYPYFVVLIKRCHDRGKVGWWSLIALIPVVGFFWVLIDLGILKGDEGSNEYGPDPVA